MKNMTVFSVGELISDSEQIYKIHKIDNGVMYYKPRVVEERHDSVECSIPMANADRAGIRKLLSKSDIDSFFEYLGKIDVSGTTVDYKSVKDVLSINDPLKTVPILKLLLKNKAGAANFSRSDEDLLGKILVHLTDEMSLITGVAQEKIRSKILSKK